MKDSPVCVLGHPFAPTGVGQLARSVIDSFLSAGITPAIVDCHGYYECWPRYRELLVDQPVVATNIFCINGDEVEQILKKLGPLKHRARNIIYPAWELPRYPGPWATQLNRFDEVWSMSRYSAESFKGSVERPVRNVSLAVAPRINHYRPRNYFGLPGSTYVFFFTFDFTSFAARKNPYAVIEAFRRCVEARPGADAMLLIKAGNSHRAQEDMNKLRCAVDDLGERVKLIDQVLDDDEIKSLLISTDAFVSLHRSEGFGLSLAEAMYFEKPVIATAYSGNMDFMNHETALLVDYDLVAVQPGEYPYHEGQHWAEPSVEQAARHMIALLDDPQAGWNKGRHAGRHIRRLLDPLSLGMNYMQAINCAREVAAADSPGASRPGS